MSTSEKLTALVLVLVFASAFFGGLLGVASLFKGRRGERAQTLVFLAPAILLLLIGLVYPAIRTIWESFLGTDSTAFVGLDNYITIFTDPTQLTVVRNTALWVILTPILSTSIGLLYAILVDRMKGEAIAKGLMFLPMAISMVAAGIIWKFMYEYRVEFRPQIGLINQLLIWAGFDSQQFLLTPPWNTLFLIAVLVWIQAGFAMTILSAAIKAIPDDIIEAARLDGVAAYKMFRHITLPSIRGSLVVVLTTIAIGVLKVFDIVRTMTGGQFDTSVIANEFYTQTFRADNTGLGSALAVILFVLVIPIIIYNARQLKTSEGR
ncbi:MAG: carbohydrate ABC transporter permease [Actinomycetota bacterium]